MTYHRPIQSRGIKPPVDVIGLSTAIIRAPSRWGVLASMREIEAMADALLMMWQVAIAAQAFEMALNAFDQTPPDATDEPQRIAHLNETRKQLETALEQIKTCQKQEQGKELIS